MPNPVRIARYMSPVAAITAEYERSFSANQVATTRPMVVTARDDPHPAHQPAVAVVDAAVQHRHHPHRDQVDDELERPEHPTAFTISLIGSRAEPGLHQVPVPEEHGVGHRTEERRPHEQAGEAQRVVTADERPRRRTSPTTRAPARAGRAAGSNSRQRFVIVVGIDLGPVIAATRAVRRSLRLAAARARRRPGARTTGAARRPRRAPSSAVAHVADERAGPVVARARHHRQDGHHAEGDAEQPAVPDAHLAPTGGDPAEQQPAGGPLREQRREVELHR